MTPAAQKLPRYEVKHINKTIEVPTFAKDKTGKLVPATKEEPFGYMVFLPNGTCHRVRNEAELKRQGFHYRPATVNMETGDVEPNSEAVSLEELCKRKTRSTRKSIEDEILDGIEE